MSIAVDTDRANRRRLIADRCHPKPAKSSNSPTARAPKSMVSVTALNLEGQVDLKSSQGFCTGVPMLNAAMMKRTINVVATIAFNAAAESPCESLIFRW